MAPYRVLCVLAIVLSVGGCMTCWPSMGELGAGCSTCEPAGCGTCNSWFDNCRFKTACGLAQLDTNFKCGNLLGMFRKPRAYDPKSYPSVRGHSAVPDEFAVSEAAKKLSTKSLRDFGYGLSKDFKNGFHQAYEDIAKGGSGETPPVPPEKYWKAHFRTAKGHERAQQWFEGYRLGAQQAQADGIPNFNTIPTSAYPGGYGVGNGTGWMPSNHFQNSPQPGCPTCNQQPTNSVAPPRGPAFNGGAAGYVGHFRYGSPGPQPNPANRY